MTASRREIIGWASYDFANSAFATTILAVIFNVYFSEVVVGKDGLDLLGIHLSGEGMWSVTVAFGMLLVCLSAPIVGAITDYTASKKKFLAGYWLTGCLATSFLFFSGERTVAWVIPLFVVALVGFEGSVALYNAFLPELAERERMGRVSAIGWAFGYVGGGLCLALSLLLYRQAVPIRMSFPIVGLWWFLFGLPMMFGVRERAMPKARPSGTSLLRMGFQKVGQTLRRIRHHRELFKFVLTFLVFNEGIECVVILSSVFAAKEIGMDQGEIIQCYLLVQAVAVVGALFFGWLADRIRNKPALMITLAVWLSVVVWSSFIRTKAEFWVLGIFIGLVMGGSQSISRALLGHFTPKSESGEFFGFFAIGGKFASVIGPLVFAAVRFFGSFRTAILSVGVFFLIGLILLCFIDERKGIAEADAARLLS